MSNKGALFSIGLVAFALLSVATSEAEAGKHGKTAAAGATEPAAKPRPALAPDPPAEETPRVIPPVSIVVDGAQVRCREHAAQPFLIRGNWFKKGTDSNKALAEAIRYRTEKYGYFQGYGNPKDNAHPPRFYSETVKFMGLPVTVNQKVALALRCVEAALNATPAKDEYHPHSAGGIRFANTYRGSEISNHVYGIALDIEPDRNTCCGCVAPWTEHPLCQRRVTSIYDRMAMPKSWVAIFERFGFYWLGHDVLQDTMHFEFLGDPEKILDRSATVAPATSAGPASSAAPANPFPALVPPGPPATRPVVPGAPLGLVNLLDAGVR